MFKNRGEIFEGEQEMQELRPTGVWNTPKAISRIMLASHHSFPSRPHPATPLCILPPLRVSSLGDQSVAEGRVGDQIKTWVSGGFIKGGGQTSNVSTREWGQVEQRRRKEKMTAVAHELEGCGTCPYRHKGSTRSRSRKSWSLLTEEISIGNWESVAKRKKGIGLLVNDWLVRDRR